MEAIFATLSPKLAEASDANKFTAKNLYQNTRQGFHSRFRAKIFKQVTWGQRLQPYRPNWLKPPLQTNSPQKIIIKTPAEAFMQDFRAEIFKQVTRGQRLQPYRPNLLKSLLRKGSPHEIIIKAPVWASIRDLRAEVFKQIS